MLQRLMNRLADKDPAGPNMSYEEARASLERHAHNARLFLAARPDVEPEILYHLATDDSTDVRRLVARNPGAPPQANSLLARDADEDVRCELARKVGRDFALFDVKLTPRARALATEVVELLARDPSARVRAILAEQTERPLAS